MDSSFRSQVPTELIGRSMNVRRVAVIAVSAYLRFVVTLCLWVSALDVTFLGSGVNMSEFMKQYAAEYAALWNRNYREAGGTDPKMFFSDEASVYVAPDGTVTDFKDKI
jgi:hypothetical protein